MLLLTVLLALSSPAPSVEPPALPAIIEVGRNDHVYALRLFPDGTAVRIFDGIAKAGPRTHLDSELVRQFFADADDPKTNFGEWGCDRYSTAPRDLYTVRYGSRVATSPDCGPADTILQDAKRVIEVAFDEFKHPDS